MPAPQPFDPAALVHRVGEPIAFSGYADDFEGAVVAVEFSLDDGVTWTRYPTPGACDDQGVSWSFAYTPTVAGRYLLKARGVSAQGRPSSVTSSFAFEVLGEGIPAFGSLCVRPLGRAPLGQARVYRSRELAAVTAEEATFLVNALGIRAVYDLRTADEVAARPEPALLGVRMVSVEPAGQVRAAKASRLAAGVIGAYGAPGERMRANYRRYVHDYPLVGMVLRSLATGDAPALVHCKNGKDRTGVVCAVLQRIAGVPMDAVMADYLASNAVNAPFNEADLAQMGVGMTEGELAILRSFFEARVEYLEAFFAEVDAAYGSFDAYVATGLRLTCAQCVALAGLVGE